MGFLEETCGTRLLRTRGALAMADAQADDRQGGNESQGSTPVFIVVAKAAASAIFEPGEHLAMNFEGPPGTFTVKFWTNYGGKFDVPVPLNFCAEAKGPADNLDDAGKRFGNAARAASTILALVANADLGRGLLLADDVGLGKTTVGVPAPDSADLARQMEVTRPRHVGRPVQTIAKCARELVKSLLDPQSRSTRALLRNMAKRTSSFDGARSHFPGRLDEGFRVMGAWDHDVDRAGSSASKKKSLRTLYTGKPDIVLALFNSPFGPDVLVATDRLSEGVDLHRFCRHLIHYELDPSPVRTLQRNGRVRRIGSWAALTGRPIRYAYPTFDGTRDEVATDIMRRRVQAFGVLLGGVPVLDKDADDQSENFADAVLKKVQQRLGKLNGKLRASVPSRT